MSLSLSLSRRARAGPRHDGGRAGGGGGARRRLHANADTILDDTEVGAAVPTPLTPAAARLITRFLNHEVQRLGAGAAAERRWDGGLTYTRPEFVQEYGGAAESKWDAARALAPGEEQADWLRREIVAPLHASGQLRLVCETAASAAFLGADAVQRECVAELPRVVESCRTAEEVRELGGLGGLGGAEALGRTPSAVERAAAVQAAFRSDCLAEGLQGAELAPRIRGGAGRPKRGQRGGLFEPGPRRGGLPGDGLGHRSRER